MVTLLGSSNNHDDGEGNVKIKKKNMQQVSALINRKKKKPERAAHFLANFLSIVARVTFSNFIEMAVRSYL